MGRRDTERSDEEATSLFARVMQERGRPHKVIPFPGLEGVEVAIWCPTEDEEIEADIESRRYLTKEKGLNALELSLAQETELAKRARETELLALVLRDPLDPEQAFVESADALRGKGGQPGLEKPQREALMAAIEDFRRERFEAKTPEEYAEIVRHVRALKDVGALSPWWMSCGSDTQVRVLEALLAAPPTPPSSSDIS
jgi:hypothetical protein